MIKNLKNKIYNFYYWLFRLTKNERKLKRFNKIQTIRVKPWFDIDGDNTLRLNYDLNPNSVVFDLGGYKGEWSDLIYKKYESYMYIFEPAKGFYDVLSKKYINNKKIQVFNFGLSSKDQEISLFLSDNSSSLINGFNTINSSIETIQLKSILNYVSEFKIDKIDLIKINIEGAEYELLEHLIENKNLLNKIDNIQVQFHDFEKKSIKRMLFIQNALSRTHYLTYYYEFVWENWKLKR